MKNKSIKNSLYSNKQIIIYTKENLFEDFIYYYNFLLELKYFYYFDLANNKKLNKKLNKIFEKLSFYGDIRSILSFLYERKKDILPKNLEKIEIDDIGYGEDLEEKFIKNTMLYLELIKDYKSFEKRIEFYNLFNVSPYHIVYDPYIRYLLFNKPKYLKRLNSSIVKTIKKIISIDGMKIIPNLLKEWIEYLSNV